MNSDFNRIEELKRLFPACFLTSKVYYIFEGKIIFTVVPRFG